MSRTFLISDTHFGHANMLKFTNRNGDPIRPGFTDVDHMDEYMISKWNALVEDEDIVWHLGDVGAKEAHLGPILKRLKGRKRLLLGNHDKCDMRFYRLHFEKIRVVTKFDNVTTEGGPSIICSHYPLLPMSFRYREVPKTLNNVNVHGHIHEKHVMLPHDADADPAYLNICVEHTAYAPVLVDDVLRTVKSRAEKSPQFSSAATF